MDLLVRIGPGAARDDLLPLFRLADDSEQQIHSYYQRGELFVACLAHKGAVALALTTSASDTVELKSIAVAASLQGCGIGSRLLDAVLDELRRAAVRRVIVATATSSHRAIAFYQKRGFRMSSIEPDFFTEARGYPPGLEEDGIPVRDRLWLALDL